MSKQFLIAFILTLVICIYGCNKSSTSNGDCGDDDTYNGYILHDNYFSQPTEIYWGVTGNKRSFTYNWTIDNNCSKFNPKVTFKALLNSSNTTLNNPFSFEAGTQTCGGLQPQSAVLIPNADQSFYVSSSSEIGMQQCYSSQAFGTIYPYLTISFTTLGSSQADSLYLVRNVHHITAEVVRKLPK